MVHTFTTDFAYKLESEKKKNYYCHARHLLNLRHPGHERGSGARAEQDDCGQVSPVPSAHHVQQSDGLPGGEEAHRRVGGAAPLAGAPDQQGPRAEESPIRDATFVSNASNACSTHTLTALLHMFALMKYRLPDFPVIQEAYLAPSSPWAVIAGPSLLSIVRPKKKVLQK